MIVVDNDVISYFWIRMDTERASLAQDVRERDSDWVAPRVWHSEFRNVLRGYMSGGYMTLAEAIDYARRAEEDLRESTHLMQCYGSTEGPVRCPSGDSRQSGCLASQGRSAERLQDRGT